MPNVAWGEVGCQLAESLEKVQLYFFRGREDVLGVTVSVEP